MFIQVSIPTPPAETASLPAEQLQSHAPVSVSTPQSTDDDPKTAVSPNAAEVRATTSSTEVVCQVTAPTFASSATSHASVEASSQEPSDKRHMIQRIGVDLNLIDITTSSFNDGPSGSAGKRSTAACVIASNDDSEEPETASTPASAPAPAPEYHPIMEIIDRHLLEQPPAIRNRLSLPKQPTGRDKRIFDDETGWTVDYIHTYNEPHKSPLIMWNELCLPTTKNSSTYLVHMSMAAFGFEQITETEYVPVIVRDLKELVRNS